MAGGNGGDCTHYFVSPSEDYIIFQEIIIFMGTSQDDDRPTKTHPSPGPLIEYKIDKNKQLRRKQLWRRSYKKQFFLFDVAQQKVIPSKFDDFNLDSEDDSEFCLYANWAPTLSANKDQIS